MSEASEAMDLVVKSSNMTTFNTCKKWKCKYNTVEMQNKHKTFCQEIEKRFIDSWTYDNLSVALVKNYMNWFEN